MNKKSLSVARRRRRRSAYLLNMRRVKMNAALLLLSLLGYSTIPEGTIKSCPSGEKHSRLKKDFSVSSWNRRTTLPCNSELLGTGSWALLTRLTNFLLLTLYTRHILQTTELHSAALSQVRKLHSSIKCKQVETVLMFYPRMSR
jgi:hypothetical protein